MISPYRDAILDLLADGVERTVEEIRVAVDAPPSARIHHVLEAAMTRQVARRETFRLRSRRIGGRLYYRFVHFTRGKEEKK
jgi:hypothetical protein